MRIHKAREVVHVEEFDTRAEAMKRERGVKSLSHAQKLKLARSGKGTKRVGKPFCGKTKKAERT